MTRIPTLLLLLLVAAPAGAQSPATFYHDAAKLYIAENNAEAERAAEAGLALAPSDQKLRALLEKIRERNEQQQQNGGSEQQDQDGAPQEGESDQQQDQNSGGQQQQSDEGDEESQQDGDPSEDPTDASGEQGEERESEAGQGDEPSDQPPDGGGGDQLTDFDVKPGEMSRAEAERILRAIQSDELELLRDVQRRRARPRYVEKDW